MLPSRVCCHPSFHPSPSLPNSYRILCSPPTTWEILSSQTTASLPSLSLPSAFTPPPSLTRSAGWVVHPDLFPTLPSQAASTPPGRPPLGGISLAGSPESANADSHWLWERPAVRGASDRGSLRIIGRRRTRQKEGNLRALQHSQHAPHFQQPAAPAFHSHASDPLVQRPQLPQPRRPCCHSR